VTGTPVFGRSVQRRGLTLLEVVIALMLFAMISVMLLASQGIALDQTLRARTERDMAYLLGYRLRMAELLPDDYEDGEVGEFPASGKSSRFLDESEIFGKKYQQYTWEVVKQETVGAGSDSAVNVGGSELDPLFSEEGGSAAESGEEIVEKESGEVDRMLMIRVTIYPPNWDAMGDPDANLAKPRSAWTAIPLANEEDEE